MKRNVLVLLSSAFVFSLCAQVQPVSVYEGKESIPTYKMGPNNPSPVFYTGRSVQGAAGHYYPYPAQTSLSDTLTVETYDMVYLENEYLKVTIIPSFGGKLFSAVDKTNGHLLFHRNPEIKPDLIGTLGAWISGGIEWCFPHHHRPTTLLPADYRLAENADGSATVWVGETERSLGLRGVVGITLHPGRSYIEATYYLNNSNRITRNFLFWANVAISADENFRTFWPPQQETGVFHNNSEFIHWPVADGDYRGVDYRGTDLTWWKNHPTPVSFFFWQGKKGFIGGYDYAEKAGTLHVGDVYHNRTSKLWQFGPGQEGLNARKKLSDNAHDYVELMTGSYSNNQPDYGWFSPYSVKEAVNYWSPVRDLEIVKNASTDASVTLQMRNAKTVFYGVNTTRLYKDATVTLKYDDETLLTKKITIDPATPFTATYQSKKELDEYRLYVELQDAEGTVLISYKPYRYKNPPLPEKQYEPAANPEEIDSVEDLYLAGRFVEQFSRPGRDADRYYLEALRKSPGDYRCNLAMGIRRLGQWRYEEAEQFLQKACHKLQVQFIQPKEGELFYYLALAQKGQGKYEEAYANFYQATWYYEWFSPAYYQLAQMESSCGNYAKALEQIQQAYATNNFDGSIIVLYSALLRKHGKKEEALALVNKLLEKDPVNFAAIYEKELLQGGNSMDKWQKNMQDVDNNYIDIALNYVNAGLFDDAIRLLSSIPAPRNPMVRYYLAWLFGNTGQPDKADEALSAANEMSYDYCFPFRETSQQVLTYAVEKDAHNEMACYLQGNLLYDRRPAEAIKAWQKASEGQANFPMIWRNLAFAAFFQQNDVDGAIDLMKKALAADADRPEWYAELENYYDLSEKDFRECLAIFEKNITVVKQDVTAPQKLVKLYNLNGEYDKAIDLLKSHHFRTWEGAREIHEYYVDSHVLKALALLTDKRHESAIEELNAALLYPENLEVGKALNDGRAAMIYYFIGQACDKLGRKKEAKSAYQKSVEAKNNTRADLIYYQAKAFEALGQTDKINGMFEDLIKQGESIIKNGATRTGIGVEEVSTAGKYMSQGYYLQALGNKGLGNEEKSSELFRQALKRHYNNLWANYYASTN
ncbi:MAG: DUF5107 domain-containing protein [Tannerellaceae bacterium]|jgi:tetratricopeptide (TPR) repeat protein|nr:DUF5107 domain-containing protein [Tannerellaceae bacterium]